MSTPAGWYDDGSGRQRWWDGSRWTDQFAPGSDAGADPAALTTPPPHVAAQYAAPQYAAPGYAPALTPVEPRQPPRLGFVGLGLAVLGTLLACTPLLITFVLGALVLIAAFIVSLIAVFRKNTAKWPSIVGICLSIIGGIVGAIVFTAVVIFTLTTTIIDAASSPFPTSTFSEQPSDPPATGDSAGRPSPEAIGKGYKVMLNEGGYHQYDDDPEFFTCVGGYFYDSDLPDDVLQDLTQGVDNTTGTVREHAIQIGLDATSACDPLG